MISKQRTLCLFTLIVVVKGLQLPAHNNNFSWFDPSIPFDARVDMLVGTVYLRRDSVYGRQDILAVDL